MTGFLQPLDTHINKSMKTRIFKQLDEMLEANWQPSPDFKGKLTFVARRRMILTHCVARAWEDLHNSDSNLVIKSFIQTGLAVNVDGSEDPLIQLRDIPDIGKDIMNDGWKEGGVNCNLVP